MTPPTLQALGVFGLLVCECLGPGARKVSQKSIVFLRVLLDPTMEDSPAIPVGRTRSSPYARQTAIVILASTWPCNTAQAAVSTARRVSFRHLRSSLALLPHDGAGSRADGLVRGLRACPQGGPGCPAHWPPAMLSPQNPKK